MANNDTNCFVVYSIYQSNDHTIGIAGVVLITIQCIVLIISIYPTEKALKEYFNDDGTRK